MFFIDPRRIGFRPRAQQSSFLVGGATCRGTRESGRRQCLEVQCEIRIAICDNPGDGPTAHTTADLNPDFAHFTPLELSEFPHTSSFHPSNEKNSEQQAASSNHHRDMAAMSAERSSHEHFSLVVFLSGRTATRPATPRRSFVDVPPAQIHHFYERRRRPLFALNATDHHDPKVHAHA